MSVKQTEEPGCPKCNSDLDDVGGLLVQSEAIMNTVWASLESEEGHLDNEAQADALWGGLTSDAY